MGSDKGKILFIFFIDDDRQLLVGAPFGAPSWRFIQVWMKPQFESSVQKMSNCIQKISGSLIKSQGYKTVCIKTLLKKVTVTPKIGFDKTFAIKKLKSLSVQQTESGS